MSDGPNGVRGEGHGGSSTPGVVVPAGITLGATWDPDLLNEIGSLLGTEAIRRGAHVLLGPTVNLHRTPVGGRTFECYSEDPRTVRRVGSGLHQGRPVARRRRHGQALRVQRHRDRADERRRARRRANTPRAVPAPVRDRHQGRRRLGRDERVQPGRRRVLRREPSTADHRAARRMGLRRSRRVRLVRGPSHRAGGQCRPRRRDAGAGPGLRFGALRCGGQRRGVRGPDRSAGRRTARARQSGPRRRADPRRRGIAR